MLSGFPGRATPSRLWNDGSMPPGIGGLPLVEHGQDVLPGQLDGGSDPIALLVVAGPIEQLNVGDRVRPALRMRDDVVELEAGTAARRPAIDASPTVPGPHLTQRARRPTSARPPAHWRNPRPGLHLRAGAPNRRRGAECRSRGEGTRGFDRNPRVTLTQSDHFFGLPIPGPTPRRAGESQASLVPPVWSLGLRRPRDWG